MQRALGLSIALGGVAIGAMCADIIQHVTFGGYVWMLGLALGGACFVSGVYMTVRA